MKTRLDVILDQFKDYCFGLSLDELAGNQKIIPEIKKIEDLTFHNSKSTDVDLIQQIRKVLKSVTTKERFQLPTNENKRQQLKITMNNYLRDNYYGQDKTECLLTACV